MERQKLQLFKVRIAFRLGFDAAQMVHTIGQTGHNHMPNPQRHVFHRGQLQETLNLVEIRAAVLEIIRFGEEFQVAQNQIRVRQHLFRFGEIAHAGGIERGVYAVRMQLSEEFLNEFGLQEWFAAGDGYAAAVFPVRTKPESLSDQLVHVGRCAAFGQPGIRIMAIDAPQRAALHKYDVSHAGAVHRAERLDGMNVSGHIATFLSLLNLSIRLDKRGTCGTHRWGAKSCAALLSPRGLSLALRAIHLVPRSVEI